MNEEEKQAIEILRNFEPDDLVECSIYIQAVEKITNLIDNQQKEIKARLKEIDSLYKTGTLLDISHSTLVKHYRKTKKQKQKNKICSYSTQQNQVWNFASVLVTGMKH